MFVPSGAAGDLRPFEVLNWQFIHELAGFALFIFEPGRDKH